MICTGAARVSLMFFNFAFWSIGITLFALGIWTKFDHNFSNIWIQLGTQISAKSINSLWLLLTICGLFSGILGFIGYIGAKRKSRSLLSIYLTLIISILVLEQVAIYFAISFQTRVKSDLNRSLNRTLQSAMNKNIISIEALDNIQKLFSCCGVAGASDYTNATLIPLSCYPDQDDSQQPFQLGCSTGIYDYVKERIPVITSALFFIIIFEIFTIICSIVVCSKPANGSL